MILQLQKYLYTIKYIIQVQFIPFLLLHLICPCCSRHLKYLSAFKCYSTEVNIGGCTVEVFCNRRILYQFYSKKTKQRKPTLILREKVRIEKANLFVFVLFYSYCCISCLTVGFKELHSKDAAQT